MFPLKDVEYAILNIAEEKYSGTIFKLWFSDLKVEEINLEKELIVFSTDNDFKKKFLMSTHRDFLMSAIEQVCGFPFRYEVNVRSSAPGEKSGTAFTPKTEEPPLHAEKIENTENIKNIEMEKESPAKAEKDIASSIEGPAIIKEYTFENFIVGDSNKFAHAACKAVANRSNDEYNPLFIYGQSGLGKTHLLYAITNQMKETNPQTRIVYKKGDEFTNELIAAIQAGSTTAFRDKYRSADVLLIDDIQFIAGKESTQEEFFHTFSALYEADKQIILTSDRPPKEIRTLEERLRTRFEWGLIADIQPPSLELRIAIIRKKSEDSELGLTDSMITYMAEKLKDNVRQIEGAIKKLAAYKMLSGEILTDEKVHTVTAEISSGTVSTEEIANRIFAVVAKKYGVTVDDIKSSKRSAGIAAARHICIYLLRRLTDYSFGKIGTILNRDHTTVLSSNQTIEDKLKGNGLLESEINDLIAIIQK